MNYFKYIEKATRPHKQIQRQRRIEARHPELRNEYDANRALRETLVEIAELNDPFGEFTQWTIE